MKRLRSFAVCGLLMLLTACASLGIQAPQTFNEKALAATASVNGASQTVFDLLKSRRITPDESDRYMDRLDDAQKGINTARAVFKTDPTSATARLEAIISLLEALQSELGGRQ